MSIPASWMSPLTDFEGRIHEELETEQVSHPVEEYQPGSPRLERLYREMAEAQRFTWPATLEFN